MNASWRNRQVLLLSAIALTCALAGCQCTPAAPPPALTTPSPYPDLAIAPANYPRVDGSTSTEPLQRIIACEIFGALFQWSHSENDDSRYVVANDLLEQLDNENYQGEKLELCRFINRAATHNGTHEAYVNLIKKTADIILVARAPSADELDLAKRRDVTLTYEPVALDAFVFLVNSHNDVDNLSIKQIRDIYSGRIKNWQQVGGTNEVIQPYQRTRNSGSQELMQSLVMKDRKMIDAPDLLTGALMSSPFLAIDDDKQGIGYSVYFYQEFMSPPAGIKAIAVDGVEPTSENIRSRTYPLVTDVFVAVRKDQPSESSAKRLFDWLLTLEGQAVVEKSGYVPILTSEATPKTAAD